MNINNPFYPAPIEKQQELNPPMSEAMRKYRDIASMTSTELPPVSPVAMERIVLARLLETATSNIAVNTLLEGIFRLTGYSSDSTPGHVGKLPTGVTVVTDIDVFCMAVVRYILDNRAIISSNLDTFALETVNNFNRLASAMAYDNFSVDLTEPHIFRLRSNRLPDKVYYTFTIYKDGYKINKG